MKFYKIQRDLGVPNAAYRAKFDEAKEYAKTVAFDHNKLLLTQVEIATDQAAVEMLLNDSSPPEKRLRAWEMTARGGFKEIPLSEVEDVA